MADPSFADDDPRTVAHRLIDCLTATKLRMGWLQRHLQEGPTDAAVIEQALAQMDHELEAAANLAQLLQATLIQSGETHDDSGVRSGAAHPGH